MKFSYLKAIVAVAEKGSLRAAARHLGLAQPVVSRTIQNAENDLGVALFERRASGVTLTPVGKQFLQRASVILLDMERARDEALQLAGSLLGKVTVGLSTVPHVAFLPKALTEFQKRYPDVELTIHEGLLPALETSLESGELDFYIGPVNDRTLSATLVKDHLYANRLLAFCRRGHPLRNAKSLTELVDAQWVGTPVSQIAGKEISPVFEKCGLPPPKIGVRGHSTLTVLMSVASTDLLAMLPQQFLHFPAIQELLEQIHVKETLAAPSLYSVRRAQAILTPAAQHFYDLLVREARAL